MNLHDLPVTFEDPIESLFAFHRRMERKLAAFARLPLHIEVRGVDSEASGTAAELLRWLGLARGVHDAQEEFDLLPLLERRIPAAERAGLAELRTRLDAEHVEIEAMWKALRRPLEPIGEGVYRKLPADDIHYFRALCALHLSREESELHRLALRHLLPGDRTTLMQRIRARRERGVRRLVMHSP